MIQSGKGLQFALVAASFLVVYHGADATPARTPGVASSPKVVVVTLAPATLARAQSPFDVGDAYGYPTHDFVLKQFTGEPRVAGWIMLVDPKRARWALVKGSTAHGKAAPHARTTPCWATEAIQAIEKQLPEDAHRRFFFIQQGAASWMEDTAEKKLLDSCRAEQSDGAYPQGFTAPANFLFPSAPVVSDMLVQGIREHLAQFSHR